MPNFLLVTLDQLIGRFRNYQKHLLKKDLTQKVVNRDQMKVTGNKVILSNGDYYLIIFA